jgi:ABC-type branched-subunit amino acid transport system ATPase component
VSTTPPPPLLELAGVGVTFGGLDAVRALDLEVHEGEIVSLIGPNGAGKTTVFNVITGLYAPRTGDIRLDGESIGGLPPHAIARRGIARTFQSLRVFLNMSVEENVMAATYATTRSSMLQSVLRTPAMRREERDVRRRARDTLGFFGDRLLGYRLDQPAFSLSYANRRRLEIARAMATGARVLLLDEPTAGMNPQETAQISELIGRLRDEAGHTICVIEHDMHVVETISDRVIALDHGVKVAGGSFEHVSSHPAVIEAYLGKGALP